MIENLKEIEQITINEEWNVEISVITVCYNSKDTITNTFDSILKQNFSSMEYIIVDGGSNDGTIQIINNYKNKFIEKNIRIQIVSEPDSGIYDAINKGLRLSRGKIISILNSDDQFESNAVIYMQAAAVKEPNVGIFYGFIRQIYKGSELVTHRYNYDLILSDLDAGIQSAAQHPTCFVRRSVYEEIGCFDTSFKLAADYDFLLRAKKNGIIFFPLDRIITIFNLGGSTDQAPLSFRMEERYRAQKNNDLISEREYKKNKAKINPTLFQKIINRISILPS
jgi:glycosyltransferase involved in cell wall biosynthesis